MPIFEGWLALFIDLQAQLAAPKQENINLRSRLLSCEQSQAKLQADANHLSPEHRLLEAIAQVVE